MTTKHDLWEKPPTRLDKPLAPEMPHPSDPPPELLDDGPTPATTSSEKQPASTADAAESVEEPLSPAERARVLESAAHLVRYPLSLLLRVAGRDAKSLTQEDARAVADPLVDLLPRWFWHPLVRVASVTAGIVYAAPMQRAEEEEKKP